MIESDGTIVASEAHPGHSTLVMVPLGAKTVMCFSAPSLCGRSGSRHESTGMLAAFWHVAHDEFVQPRTCGSLPVKSISTSLPLIVTLHLIAMLVMPVPSESTQDSE